MSEMCQFEGSLLAGCATVMQRARRHLPENSGHGDLWPTHFTPRQSCRISGNDVTRRRTTQGSLGIKWRSQSATFQAANNMSNHTEQFHFVSNSETWSKSILDQQIGKKLAHLTTAERCTPTNWYRPRWLGGVVVRTLDLRLSRRWFESRSWHCLVVSEIGDRHWQVNYLGM